MEKAWQHLHPDEAGIDARSEAWDTLITEPDATTSIAIREWANGP